MLTYPTLKPARPMQQCTISLLKTSNLGLSPTTETATTATSTVFVHQKT